MEFLDWLVIGLLSLAVLCLLFAIVCLVNWYIKSKQLQVHRKQRPPKKKPLVKRWRRTMHGINQQKRIFRKRFFILLLLGSLLIPLSFYVRYYQATTLSSGNSDALVQGYALTQEIERDLKDVSTTDNPEQLQATIYDVAARLASYGTETPDPRLSQEGKLLMKDLFERMKRLGINLSGISIEQMQDPDQNGSYLSDVERLKSSQQKVFEYFRIDESTLSAS
ncbi:hypothetical protein [Enterococcus sp. HY326]|uniref:hypothetical protein n=1 Tax=Enterococcus sp. HY326 TaxID=2971265 RepID=UPI00223F4BAC|nr:hypothetical protein [Enterococcus sp. HY326]